MIEENKDELTQGKPMPAAEYLNFVLKEVRCLAESAIRLAAQQSDWKTLQIAIATREIANRHELWLAAPDNES